MRLFETGEFDEHGEGRAPTPLDDLEPAADEELAAAILLDSCPDAVAVGLQSGLIDDIADVEDAVGGHRRLLAFPAIVADGEPSLEWGKGRLWQAYLRVDGYQASASHH